MNLSPIIKWTGGKRKEIKNFKDIIPIYKHYVEPFFGGGALYFYENNINGFNTINDFDIELINFYKMVKTNNIDLIKKIDKLKLINNNHEEMEKQYYKFRDGDNSSLNELERAVRFLYVNQLAFGGMRRFNKSGKFNVPFGHYKTFNPKITKEHIELLQKTDIKNDDTLNILNEYDDKDTFIFLDPPYTRVFNKYSHENIFGNNEQIKLKKCLSELKMSKWMLVINNSDEIRKLYKSYNFKSYKINYGINIRNRFKTDVEHLIITNY